MRRDLRSAPCHSPGSRVEVRQAAGGGRWCQVPICDPGRRNPGRLIDGSSLDIPHPENQRTRDVEPMLGWCWPSVVDAGTTSNQHWFNVSSLLARDCPANTRLWTNDGIMFGYRLRRWPNIKPSLFQRLVFAGWLQASVCHYIAGIGPTLFHRHWSTQFRPLQKPFCKHRTILVFFDPYPITWCEKWHGYDRDCFHSARSVSGSRGISHLKHEFVVNAAKAVGASVEVSQMWIDIIYNFLDAIFKMTVIFT